LLFGEVVPATAQALAPRNLKRLLRTALVDVPENVTALTSTLLEIAVEVACVPIVGGDDITTST
jgi:hypothetical protein